MLKEQEQEAVVLVDSSEDDDIIWITVDEVAGESSQGEEEGARGKRKRKRKGQDEEEVLMEPMFRRREHGGDKIRNWSLRPRRLVLIMGDSNMARLPAVLDDRVQVECYPGAHWFHAYEILRNRTPTTDWITAVTGGMHQQRWLGNLSKRP